MTTQQSADLAPSLIRTIVPLIIGPVLARFCPGLTANDPTVLLGASAVFSYLYYVIVRMLELKAPTLGYLLGMAKAPTYVTPPAIVTDSGGTREVGAPETPVAPVPVLTEPAVDEPAQQPAPEPVPAAVPVVDSARTRRRKAAKKAEG